MFKNPLEKKENKKAIHEMKEMVKAPKMFKKHELKEHVAKKMRGYNQKASDSSIKY